MPRMHAVDALEEIGGEIAFQTLLRAQSDEEERHGIQPAEEVHRGVVVDGGGLIGEGDPSPGQCMQRCSVVEDHRIPFPCSRAHHEAHLVHLGGRQRSLLGGHRHHLHRRGAR